MGAYGPIEPGTLKEHFAIIALRMQQAEEITKVDYLVTSNVPDEKGENLAKARKQFIKIMEPFSAEELRKSDERKMALLKSEVKKGSFSVTPLIDIEKERKGYTLRLKPRKRGRRQ